MRRRWWKLCIVPLEGAGPWFEFELPVQYRFQYQEHEEADRVGTVSVRGELGAKPRKESVEIVWPKCEKQGPAAFSVEEYPALCEIVRLFFRMIPMVNLVEGPEKQ